MADTFQIAPGWSVSGAWVMASGRPYTPASEVHLVWFPSGAPVYEVQFGAKNSARLPPYHRLDLSSERDWLVRGMKLSVGGTVFNVYDHTNVLYKDYEAIARTITSYDVTLMGLAVNAFVRIGF